MPSFSVKNGLQHTFNEASDQISSHLITELKCDFLFSCEICSGGKSEFFV